MANQILTYTSSHENLVDEEQVDQSGIQIPCIYDRDNPLAFTSTFQNKSKTYGNVGEVYWVIEDEVGLQNTLTVSTEDGAASNSLTVEGVETPASEREIAYVRLGADYEWYTSDPAFGGSRWKLIPYPYISRVYEGYTTDGGTRALRPEGAGIQVTYQDFSMAGLIAPSLDNIGGGSSTLVKNTDENSVAVAYWAPMPYSGDYGEIRVRAENDTGATFSTALYDPELISAEVVGRDGEVRPLAENGLALTADREVRIFVKNHIYRDIFVKLDITPLGQDTDVFDLDATPGLVFDPDTNSYHLHAPGQNQDGYVRYTYILKLNEDSDGADVKLTAFYNSGDSHWDEGEPVRSGPIPGTTLHSFGFRVGVIRLEKADLYFHRLLSGLKGIYIVENADTEIPNPEYLRNKRYTKPEKGEPYNDSMISPTAIVKNKKLLIEPSFSCSGIDSWTLSVECMEAYSEGPELCPYGNFEKVIYCDGAENDPDDSILESDTVADSVMATMNHYRWVVNDIQYEKGVHVGETITIEDTYHRVYTVYDEPIQYANFGPGKSLSGPWLLPLEISNALISSCPPIVTPGNTLIEPGSLDEDEYIRKCITMGVFESLWVDSDESINDSIYFTSHLRKIRYEGGIEYAKNLDGYLYPFVHIFNLSEFNDYLIMDSPFKLGTFCRTYAAFTCTLNRSLGVSIYSRYLRVPVNGLEFGLDPVKLSGTDINSFSPGDHVVNIFPPAGGIWGSQYRNVYDSVPMYYSNGSYHYIIGQLSESEYLELTELNRTSPNAFIISLPTIYLSIR